MTFIKYDDTNAALIPSDAVACSYYANGRYANLNAVRKQCPHAKLLPVIVIPGVIPPLKELVGWENGVQIDVERTDWTPQQAGTFAKACLSQGVSPHIYSSLSDVPAVVASLHAAGIDRSQYKLNTAHWTFQEHICSGIHTVIGPVDADATQFTDKMFGRNLDASLCKDDFFGSTVKPPPAPKPPAPKRPSGVAHFEGTFDFATGHWTVHRVHKPGSLVFTQHPKQAKAEITIGMHDGHASIKAG
jgi:hypothetical protein